MATPTQAKSGRPVRPEDLNELRFLGEVQISPDGKQVFYDVSYINREKNIYQGEIWQQDLDGDSGRPITSGQRRDSSPRLSPDGRVLAFLSDRGEDNKKQVFLLDLNQPGEARQLTRFQSGINSITWSPDSRYLAVLVETPDDPDKAAGWSQPETAEARRDREAREQEDKRVGGQPVIFDRLNLRADGRRTLIPGDAHVQLWLADTHHPAIPPLRLTAGPFDVAQPTFSPDGQQIIFNSTRDPWQADFTCISDLWRIDTFAGLDATAFNPLKLTASRGPASGPVWSPDGRRVAFSGHTNPKDGSYREQPRLWVLEVGPQGAAGEPQCLTAGFDRPVTNLLNTDMRVSGEIGLSWSADSETIFFGATSEGSVQIFQVPASGRGEVQAVTAPQRHIYALDLASQSGYLAFAAAGPVCPGDVFIQGPGDRQSARQLTHLNREWLEQVYLAEPETVRVRSQDGSVELESWLLKPPGFDPARQYPLVLEIHGGPHTAYGHSFYLEFQMLAGQGNVVLFSNPRGSVGHGYDFGAAIYNDWGHHDYDDLMTALDHVISLGYIDETRLGVTGGSYGGYMTNWIVTHTDRFKAALTQRCVSNLVSMYTLSDIGYSFVESEFEGDIWSNPRIWERSPMAHANKARTPLLMLHSEADYRCPIEQAEEFFIALKKSGCPVELVRTPNEDHNLSRSGSPDHRIGRMRRIGDWFAKHLNA